MRGKSKTFAILVAILFALTLFVVPAGAAAAKEDKTAVKTEQGKKTSVKAKKKTAKKSKATKPTAKKAKAKEAKPKAEKAK